MKWLSGSQQQDAQKCPMCNSDITVEILEKAIEEDPAFKGRNAQRTVARYASLHPYAIGQKVDRIAAPHRFMRM